MVQEVGPALFSTLGTLVAVGRVSFRTGPQADLSKSSTHGGALRRCARRAGYSEARSSMR